MKKIILVLVSFIFLSGFRLANAEVIINEVQLNPIEERFIELYNSGSSNIDLTNWYIQRKTKTQIQNGSDFSSLVSKPNFENKKINANSYFLISRSSMTNADIVLENFSLTESNIIQIKNLNQEVIDKVGWGDISANDCGGTCALNPTEGKSIQRTSNGWIVAIPTPRKVNEITNSPSSSVRESSSSSVSAVSSSTQGANESKTKVVEIPKIKTKIIAKTVGFVNIPIEFTANTTGYGGERLIYGNYFWNFGDGDFKEIKISDSQKFTHRYFYPGEYNISLEYFSNPYSLIPDSEDKITIVIVPAEIIISKVGDEKDFFIELTNNTNYDVDISKWILLEEGITKNNINETKTKNFIFPKNTILGAKKKIILPSKITNLFFIDKGSLKLLNMNNDIIFDYTFGKEKDLEILKVSKTISRTPLDIVEKNNQSLIISKDTDSYQTATVNNDDFNNLTANVFSSLPENTINETSTDKQSSRFLSLKNIKDNFVIFLFIIFIILSSSAVYFIRRKKIEINDGDDFEILDE